MAPPARPVDREAVLAALRALAAEHRRSTLRVGAHARGATDDLKDLRPGVVAELAALLRAGDPAVDGLGGTFFAILVRDLDATTSLCPVIVDLLHDAAPRRRAFACEALGYLGWRDAVPHLRAILADDAVVDGYTEGTTVATFARHALKLLGEVP